MSDTSEVIREWIGFSIRERRLELKVSQQQLADAIGQTRTSITQYEAGRILPPLDVLYLIAGTLLVDPRTLLPDPAQVKDGNTSDLVRQILLEKLEGQRAEAYTCLDEIEQKIAALTAQSGESAS